MQLKEYQRLYQTELGRLTRKRAKAFVKLMELFRAHAALIAPALTENELEFLEEAEKLIQSKVTVP